MTKHTYKQIAEDFDLWRESIDLDGFWDEARFDATDTDTKIGILTECFGDEYNYDLDVEVTDNAREAASDFWNEFHQAYDFGTDNDWDAEWFLGSDLNRFEGDIRVRVFDAWQTAFRAELARLSKEGGEVVYVEREGEDEDEVDEDHTPVIGGLYLGV